MKLATTQVGSTTKQVKFWKLSAARLPEISPRAQRGGIENFGSVNVQNTILAGNLAGQSTGESSDDCRSLSGTITSGGHNLVGQNCSPFTILSDLVLGQGVLLGKND